MEEEEDGWFDVECEKSRRGKKFFWKLEGGRKGSEKDRDKYIIRRLCALVKS